MGRKTHLPLAIVLALLVCILCAPALGADAGGATAAARSHFSSQLNSVAHAIYDKLSDAFEGGRMRDGVTNVDITDVVSEDVLVDYAEKGNRSFFNDFSAAKDAFDLEHPEAWYVDSSYLCLRVGKVDGRYRALVGPGRSDTYYLNGQTGYELADGRRVTFDVATIDRMDADLRESLDALVKKVSDLTLNPNESEESLATRRIKAAHDAVVRAISYRFEDECAKGNSLFVRTIYGARTHEGVCEAYARTLQYVLGKVDIPCILMSGLQTGNESPEQHMWCAVEVSGVWYGVDPTWDDPVQQGPDGRLVPSPKGDGDDGRERTTYLLVGTGTLADWVPNGVFSADGFEFHYPELSETDYVGGEVFNSDGLSVYYSSAAEMEGVSAGSYIVRYNGGGILAAGEQGRHLLVREHYADPDFKQEEDWYYVEAGIYISRYGAGSSQYFNDDGSRLILVTPSCDYVEFALTSETPEGYGTWSNPDLSINTLDDHDKFDLLYRTGDEGLTCQTGHLENVNCDYRPNPYVSRQVPTATSRTATGTHIAKVMFDDALTYPSAYEDMKPHDLSQGQLAKVKPRPDERYRDYVGDSETSSVRDGFEDLIRVPESEAHLLIANPYADDAEADPIAKIAVSYLQKDISGSEVDHTLQVSPHFDKNGDGYVDADTAHLNWLYECKIDYPHLHVPYGYANAGEGCKLVGVEFEFDPSAMWADDLTYYQFQIEGLVGSHSGKEANPWGYLVCDPECPFAYRSQGIDWNLWGRPNLLDNTTDLNLEDVTLHGTGGYEQRLDELQSEMNLERLDGRLTLVAEELTDKLSAPEELEGRLQSEEGIPAGAIKGRSLYEINFSNICRKTISEVTTGDSMRVQVGFPAGYDASSNVVFKAYHFTRDDSGAIVSVEEIPVIVTEYGLLVLCDSFSPFEMVAMDPTNPAVLDAMADDKISDRSVVVASDGHVRVTVGGRDVTSGKASIVDMEDGAPRTFTFTPDPGYQVQGVAVTGNVHQLVDNGDGTKSLTLTSADLEALAADDTEVAAIHGLNAVLSVSSVSSSVAARDASAGFVETTPAAGDPVETEKGDGAIPAAGDESQDSESEGTEGSQGSEGTEGSGDATGRPEGDVMEVYRLYNPYSGEHLFTENATERAELAESGWNDEGIAWYSPLDSGSAVYRLYNPHSEEHHYTADLIEVQDLVKRGWSFEGFAWRDAPTNAASVYRLFNPYEDGPGAHHYTTDTREYDHLGKEGWIQEQVAWRAFATQ